MITDADLKKIDKMLDRVEEHLDSRIEESSLELQKEILLLKSEMKRDFRKVHNDQNLIIKHFNEEFLDLQERVEKLEKGISPQTFS